MEKLDIYVPSSMLQFQCGQSGRCCGGWDIGIDKASYNRLKKVLTENKMSRLLKSNVKKNNDPKKGYYAFIKFTDGKCGLLDEKGLCSVHDKFGIEALPDLCKVFPRLIYQTPFGKEMSITFACPNAAELLKSKEKITKIKNPDNFFYAHGTLYYGRVTSEIFERDDIVKFYFEIEYLFLEIIQSRQFTIDERLVILGLTIKRLENLSNPTPTMFEDLCQSTKKLLSQNYIKEEIKKINPSMMQQISLLKEFINLRLMRVPDENLDKVLKEIAQIFHFDQPDDEIDQSLNNYLEHYNSLYAEEIEANFHVLENFLSYFILRKHYIVYNLKDAYFLTIFFYSIIRLTAIGLAVLENKKVDEEILIKAIGMIEKIIGHSHDFYNNIIGYMRTQNLTTVSHGITLLLILEKMNQVITDNKSSEDSLIKN